ncbi:MAG: T9SS type A sorting domain-containing protein [Ignavibacteria bacterium]|nr:T9SS type A sorting domain-containing protein [Ignavibacteria bacterium]
MHQLLINGNQKEALNINDVLEKEVSDKTANKLALFRKGFIYLTEENNRTGAEKVFGEFITKYPEDELTEIVNYTLGKTNELNKAVTLFEEEKTAPEGFVLDDCYPNPFNPATTIRYKIPQDGHISLKVYDMLGREVAQLVNEVKRAGEYTVNFDGSKLSSGVYIYKLVGNNVNISKKMILMK